MEYYSNQLALLRVTVTTDLTVIEIGICSALPVATCKVKKGFIYYDQIFSKRD